MDYFRIRQDRRYLRTPVITNLTDIIKRRTQMSEREAQDVADFNVAYASSEVPLDFVDVLDSQLFLVRDEVREVFHIYEPALAYKSVCILNNLMEEYQNYHAPVFRTVDCYSEQSLANRNRSNIEKLVLRESAVGDYSIFKVKDVNTDVVVIRLDVAESLLRRGIRRFQLERAGIGNE